MEVYLDLEIKLLVVYLALINNYNNSQLRYLVMHKLVKVVAYFLNKVKIEKKIKIL